MNHHDSRQSGRRSGRGSRRPSSRSRGPAPSAPSKPVKLTLWQRLAAFFGGGGKSAGSNSKSASSDRPRQERRNNDRADSRPARKVEQVEVTSPKLYVGNLSFNATESDLFELFKGVGSVRNAEIVTNKYNDKSKGFGFVTMASVEEAKRAVLELHDKEFLNRKLLVSGAKSGDRESDDRD